MVPMMNIVLATLIDSVIIHLRTFPGFDFFIFFLTLLTLCKETSKNLPSENNPKVAYP